MVVPHQPLCGLNGVQRDTALLALLEDHIGTINVTIVDY
jgi:hypothetical protein